MNASLSELIWDVPAHRVGHRLRMIQITDAKSLFDCISRENPSLEDKRSLISVRSIQEIISRDDIFWTPTFLMRADSLTKVDKELQLQMAEWCQKPFVQLRDGSKKQR